MFSRGSSLLRCHISAAKRLPAFSPRVKTVRSEPSAKRLLSGCLATSLLKLLQLRRPWLQLQLEQHQIGAVGERSWRHVVATLAGVSDRRRAG